MIKFSHTIFYVKDVLKTVQFYESAFGIKPKFVHESNAYAELMTDGVTLGFASEELGRMNFPKGFQPNTLDKAPQACEIALTTNDPAKYYKQALKSGAVDLTPPTLKPWGQIVAYVRDPNGILIEIAGELPQA
ncbi:MAG: VOC family protein [Rhabdochlamydiaceae bacterium]|jgi:catechol 2,3-dioxygenase-like lactoylglutathione lyase family enzyme